MKSLKEYLDTAKDYLEADGSVERLKAFYEKKSEKAEELWKKTFEDVEVGNINQKALFLELLEKKGLYVFDERIEQRGLINKSIETNFSLRVFRLNPRNDSYVAVLKVCGLTYPLMLK